MKFYYISAAGEQTGPVDEAVIRQEIAAGRIGRDSAVRNALLGEFRSAGEFDCFAEVLAEAEGRGAVNGAAAEKSGVVRHLFSLAGEKKKRSSALERSFKPEAAGVTVRFMAWLTDFIIFAAAGAVFLYLAGISAASVRIMCYGMIFFALLYYSITLGVFAQTFGMYFWGIFLRRSDGGEAYMQRCFIYALLLLPLGFVCMIFFVPLTGRNLPELLTGTHVIRVFGSSGL